MIKKLLFILTVTCASFTMNAQNLFLNGGLESGTGNTFTNWTTWANPNITEETVNTHGGLRALKAVSTVAGNDWDVQFMSDAVTTVVGTSYEVRFWIKSLSGTSTMRVSTSGGTPNYQSAQSIGKTDWQQVTYAFTASDIATRIALDLGKFADTFYIDDLEMYALTTNNIVNGGFELGSGDTFTNWTKAGVTANLTSESVNFRSGVRALKAISTGTNEWDLVMQSDAVTTEIGKYYEGAIWIKSVGGASKMRLSTSGGTSEYGASVTIGKDNWQRVALVFKATATATKLNLDLGKSTETFYIDDVSFNSAQTVALGVADFNNSNDKVEFYPNPVKDYLNISSNANIKSIIINDLTGKTVQTIKAENIQSVDLSGLNNGMYILSTDTNKQFKFLKN